MAAPAPAAKRARASPEPRRSWLPVAGDSQFPLANIPFGVASFAGSDDRRVVTRVGDHVIDLRALGPLLPATCRDALAASTLNAFMATGRPVWREARAAIQALLAAEDEEDADAALRTNAALTSAAVRPVSEATMHLPADIGDYTDFYSSREHATNVGVMFRGAANALQPNWLHLPVGYHGRSSSVVVSGTECRRPCGQLQVHGWGRGGGGGCWRWC
jgi:fumarylacetoacetase